MRFNDDATTLLDRQAGVAARRQLLEAGHTGRQVDAMIRRGHLEPLARGVYRRTASGRSAHQEEVAAILRCGPGARVTGERLLGHLGVEGFSTDDDLMVLVPKGRRVRGRQPPATRVDHASHLHRAAYGPVAGTTPARTLVEMSADRSRTDDGLLSTYDRMRWRGVLTQERLTAVVDQLPGHPGAQRLQRLLVGVVAVVESPAERRLDAELATLRPPLEWQVWVAPDLRVDALWRDVSLVIEYQGGRTHDDSRDRERDAARHDRLRALGYEVVVVDRHDLRDVAALRARLLAARRTRARQLAAA